MDRARPTTTFLFRMLRASRRSLPPPTLDAMQVDDAKTQVEECEAILSDFQEVDASVNSAFYLVSSLLHKTLGNAGPLRPRFLPPHPLGGF